MKTLATKQLTNKSVKQNQNGEKGRSRSVSPLSTGMPLLQRQCACGGGCPHCQEKLGIQTKLKISEPGDQYEQEADRLADEVMRMPEPSVQRQVEPEEEEEMVQRKAIANPMMPPIQRKNEPDQSEPSEVPSVVHEVLNSPGHSLSPSIRTFMEPRFGYDFSQVRLHTSPQAAESARAVNACAFTVGRNIVLGAGQYAPETTEGRRLLAHELTHVIQQNTSPMAAERVQRGISSFLGFSGSIRFTSCTEHGHALSDFAVMPEEGSESFTPEDGQRHEKVDGFWWRYHDPTEWLKISGDCHFEVTCTETGISRQDDCTFS
ncbi:MAG TPA: hypothetical protein DDZ80_01605 [Cyanobacteria bacterium UBA8803]|nr:hypothetical protein [Cyanobacteria bacterium UBA9273]HBL57296.1 hypothetical protein [Cyanobacteria bacterium UBA8803]